MHRLIVPQVMHAALQPKSHKTRAEHATLDCVQLLMQSATSALVVTVRIVPPGLPVALGMLAYAVAALGASLGLAWQYASKRP
ncbi:MAG TPA: hypothetical protein VHS58_14030, partial [Acetobacteraceae bacterium]|nr:hypothetical protein [Acetobacteraceae bacterium]